MYALIDPGSTHSYVCIEHIFDKVPVVEKLAYDMHVTSPLGNSVSVNSVYRNCPIVIQAREFLADLITLPVTPAGSRSDPIGGSEPKSGARYYLYYILGLSWTCSFSELYLYL